MTNIHFSPRRSRKSGQVMALGAISMLVLALMVFLDLAVLRSVHERIRLQNYADAQAYSLAVQEARSFNYFAYTNRGIANAYVAMATLSAYMSEAAMTADIYLAMTVSMGAIGGQEWSQCFCYWGVPCRPQHCLHAIQAWINAAMYVIKWIGGTQGSQLRKLDSPFRNAMSMLNLHIQALYRSQQALYGAMDLLFSGDGVDTLKNRNLGSKTAGNATALKVANIASYMCAIDDPIANAIPNPLCTRSGSTSKKKMIMTDVVNATRPNWTWDRSGNAAVFLPTGILYPTIQAVQKDATFSGFNFTAISGVPNFPPLLSGGRTAMTDGSFPGFYGFSRDVSSGIQGKSITSYDWGNFFTSWKHGAAGYPLNMISFLTPGRINNGSSSYHDTGILQLFNNPHSGGSHSSPTIDPSQFVEYNISSNNSDRYNQPVVYYATNADLRTNDYNKKGPWEINESGAVEEHIGGSDNPDGALYLYDRNKGHAVSKAMVYYHRMGDWKEYPNFFNPYWRAKLESFDSFVEYNVVVGATGDTDSLKVADPASLISPGSCNLKAR